jgi:hypothetical protein
MAHIYLIRLVLCELNFSAVLWRVKKRQRCVDFTVTLKGYIALYHSICVYPRFIAHNYLIRLVLRELNFLDVL